MAAAAALSLATQQPLDARGRVSRGIDLALGGGAVRTVHLDAGAGGGGEGEEVLPRRKDGLRPLPPKIPDSLREANDGGSRPLPGGTGVGLLAAFVDSTRSPEESFLSAADAQQRFDASLQDVVERVGAEMCFICDWFKEPWPLEDKDGRSTCRFLGALPLKVELDWPSSAPPKESVLVFGDRSGLCRRMLAKAPQYRVGTAKYVDEMPWDLTPEAIKALLQERKWDLVLYGLGLDFPESNAVDDVMAHLDDVARVYLELGKLVQSVRKSCKRLAVVTRDIFTEDPRKHRKVGQRIATASTLWGMTNCLRVELEELPVQYIDLELSPDDSCLEQAASELFRLETFGRNTVRILNSGRFVMRQVAAQDYRADLSEFELPSEGVIAITGGNGSLAQVFAKHLLERAEQQNARNADLPPVRFELRLLSRSGVVREREMPAWLEVVRLASRLGIHVEHAKCDVSRQASVEAFVADCTPNLVGVIHTAGVLQDAMLQNQTWQKMEVTLGCKSRAALYLHDALQRHPNPGLELFWVFSTNSVYGNTGQVNYAGANFYLDGLMRHRRALGLPGVSMQWGAWGEAGMAAAMSDAMKQGIAMSHMPFFSNAEGFAGMYTGISTGLPSICIEKFNPSLLLGMKAQADSVLQSYDRNFTSGFCPTPPPRGSPVKAKDMYDVYRMYVSLTDSDGERRWQSGLSWQAHSEPLLRRRRDEEDEPLW